jgi:GT2 family glycosyltransferase
MLSKLTDSMVKISVVIPVYKGNKKLKATLRAYESVRFPKGQFEIVIVSDEVNPELRSMMRSSYSYRIVFSEVEHKGQSFASNRASSLAVGEYLLFTCQDIIPHPNILQEHLKKMSPYSERSRVILMGYTPYVKKLSDNNFLNFLINGGPQFAYHLFKDGDQLKGDYLYAANFFIRSSDFNKMGGFDEEFPYGCQDSDFGIRWCKSGGTIIYNKKSVGFHDDFVTLEDYCKKVTITGQATYKLHLKHADYFERKREYFNKKIVECYYLTTESCINDMKQEAIRTNSPELYREILDFYFWKSYYLASVGGQTVTSTSFRDGV